MASQPPQLHFVLFPLMSPGHMLPMIDLATMLSQHNAIVTLVTTPHNATRFSETFARASQSGLQLRLVQLQFPSNEAGFPEGCENFDMLPSMGMGLSFFIAANNILQDPAEKVFEELTPRPHCIISDCSLPYTAHIATKFNIPRISFYGVSCFCLLWQQNLVISKVLENIKTDSEYFVIPDIPDKIETTKAQTPEAMNENWKEFVDKMAAAEMVSYGVVMNSFEELEGAYARDYKKARNDKLWCVGPVSLRNKDHLDKARRGNKASIDVDHCMKWLDLQKPSSVIYACLGSICNLTPLQLIELGMALEASKRPFIWVIRERNQSEELNRWIKESGFEERTKSLGLLIRGWAPQVLILSHPAIGGFLTHCGWNSTLEAICAGVPMLTWPLFGDQFFNEKFVVQILRVGVRVGVESPVKWGDEEKTGVLVKKEDVEKAIDKLMDESNETEERRKRARELAEMAKRAVEEGGSSHFNVTLLIQDIMQQSNKD
ncbi:UDP-glycosyltransferase 73C6-like isoform X2 [Gastrolobium bilobum]|uniref:UDP-glycosyltransferase 73C6-like isoform X2 n=1 Tax=Gastrolobium bilobum TaxID=150636 RepID=UPI002AAFE532|nr:UDP-glycosyltransferase 73C6-like isoform X2 [Gastrolobium bilobum]